MTVTNKSLEKHNLLRKLESLLDVAGTETPWSELGEALRKLPNPMLIALVYRVERAREEAYSDGIQKMSVI